MKWKLYDNGMQVTLEHSQPYEQLQIHSTRKLADFFHIRELKAEVSWWGGKADFLICGVN